MEQEQQATNAPPMLKQDPLTKDWRGEDDECIVVLTNQAFDHYVDVYLETRGLKAPNAQQRHAASEAVRRLTYWHDYAGYETDVRVRRKGGSHAPTE
jgi:hypothetical protein